MNLSQVDLNLLLVLHTVLEEGSAAAAARVLHVTPPAVSNALARLRALFDDPLVVRSGRGLAPTPRALELRPHLRAAIDAVGRALAGDEGFDPRTTPRTFAIALSDAHQLSDLPRIARAFASTMPRATLQIVSVDALEAGGGLAGGAADAALAPAHPLPPGHHAAPLYDEESVLLARRGHPAAAAPLTPEVFNACRHVDIHLVLGRGGLGHRSATQWFSERGLRREIAAIVPTFLAAAIVAAETDLLTGMPRRVAEALTASMPLTILTMPGASLRFSMQLLWHARTDADPGARAFRGLVIDALADPTPASRGRGGGRRPRPRPPGRAR
ncbi:MAG: LysR family transcriptional regulator [Nannocystaceae bacterium]